MAYDTLEQSEVHDNIQKDPCFFGKISRETAEAILSERATFKGTYLIREGDGGFRLTVIDLKKGDCVFFNYKIQKTESGSYCIDPGFTFPTIADVIVHYKGKHTNMPCPLTRPCPQTGVDDGEPTKSTINGSPKKINSESVKLKTHLFSGKHFEAWKGEIFGYESEVFIKMQNEENHESPASLLHEAQTLTTLCHKNVIKLFGVSRSNPVCLILEYCWKGDLLNYLLRRDNYLVSKAEKLRIAQEVAGALYHVSRMNFVHRNVRSCNVLLNRDYACKLAGFGHAVELNHKKQYIGKEDDNLNSSSFVRWMAIEAIENKTYSAASDVWAFGCLLFEIFTEGEVPYFGTLTQQVIAKVKKGYRPPKPPGASDGLYGLMLSCWFPEPEKRMTFDNIQKILTDLRRNPKKPSSVAMETSNRLPSASTVKSSFAPALHPKESDAAGDGQYLDMKPATATKDLFPVGTCRWHPQ